MQGWFWGLSCAGPGAGPNDPCGPGSMILWFCFPGSTVPPAEDRPVTCELYADPAQQLCWSGENNILEYSAFPFQSTLSHKAGICLSSYSLRRKLGHTKLKRRHMKPCGSWLKSNKDLQAENGKLKLGFAQLCPFQGRRSRARERLQLGNFAPSYSWTPKLITVPCWKHTQSKSKASRQGSFA